MDRLAEQLAPHLRRADRVIVDRLADAASHAHRGRLAVAAQRLIDLHHALIGPHGEGVVGDARAAAYRHAHAEYDPAIHDPARMLPTPEAAAAARTAPVGGIDAHRDLGIRIDRARRGLITAMGSPAAIDTWHQQQATALRAWARRTLSDGQVSIDNVTRHLRLRKEDRGQP